MCQERWKLKRNGKEGLGGPSPTNNLARLASEMPLWLGEATCGFLKTSESRRQFLKGEGLPFLA